MKWIRSVVAVLIIIFVSDSCLKQPDYSNNPVPTIQLQSITYKSGGTNNDSLIFIVKFTDGDGDLGVDQDENAIYLSATDSIDIQTPYYFIYDTIQTQILGYVHEKNLDLSTDIRDNNGAIIPDLSYVDYKAKRTRSVFDTLPELSCNHYAYPTSDQPDTVYYLDNINNHNFFVYAYYKNGNTFTLFNPNDYFNGNGFSQCANLTNFLKGRFPVLSSDLGKKSPLDGTIIYKYSSLILPAFRGLTMKFDIYITDRTYISSEGHFQRSNVIHTGEYKF